MCRNIRPLFNFEPPATEQEIQAAAIQFVRKVSGSQNPSRVNQAACDRAVQEISASLKRLLGDLTTQAPAKNREVEAERARERSRSRYFS